MSDSQILEAILDHVQSMNDMQAFWAGFTPMMTMGIAFICYKFVLKVMNDDDI